MTVVTTTSARAEHERLRAAGDPRVLPDAIRLLFCEEPSPSGHGAAFSHMHAYSARVHDVLREAYGDYGPDLIEFCDYLAEGFVTIQAAHTRAQWLENTLVCVRLHTTSELCNVLDAHVSDDFPTVALYDAERYCLRHADRILWSGGDVLGTYERYYGVDALAPAVKIADAFLDECGQDPGREGGPPAGQPVRLLYVGRLERRKGPQNLVRGLLDLPRDDWRLTLLGSDTRTGPLATSVRDQIELMIAGDPRVLFAAPVPRDEVGPLIRAHDLVVLPSLWECWPNSGREALQQNRPLLGSPVGGLCEIIQADRSGWLSAGTDATSLAAAVAGRLDDPASITDLIASGAPRSVFEELTDRQRLVDGYRELLFGERPRAHMGAAGDPPLVSVVVPYFRLEKLVEETLDSVATQSYPNIETIVVNDGSLRHEDASVVGNAALRPGVTVVTQVNSGLGAARNFGISQARGTYILPLDADDLIEPGFVARCVHALEADASLAYVGTWVEYMKPDATRIVDPLGGYMPYGNWSSLLQRNNVAGVCSCVIRRRLFDLGFRYSHELTSYEDWFLYWQLARAGHHGGIAPERLFRYRVRDDSMIRKVGTPRMTRLLGELRGHLREDDVRWTRPEVAPVAARQRAAPTSADAEDGRAEVLERANAELRAANAALARDHIGTRDAAESAVIARYAAALEEARERIGELETRQVTPASAER
ncbi:MAG: glycosyltransferase [Actinomycetota bacterium]|nr:glycosyltransferase [Actinomycetota bacterium]